MISTSYSLNKSYNNYSSTVSKISSGTDDSNVANMAISTSMNADSSALQAAASNVTQANDLLNTASGGLQNISDLEQNMASLATQASSGALSDQDRSALNQQFQSDAAQVNQIAAKAQFNGVNTLDGSLSGSGAATFQVGTKASDIASVSIGNAAISQKLDISTQAGASQAEGAVQSALTSNIANEAGVGAEQSVLNSTASNISQSISSTEAASAQLSETDVASSSTQSAIDSVQMQASITMIKKTNQMYSETQKLLD